jgi:nitrogen fixation protein NifU and related proteins
MNDDLYADPEVCQAILMDYYRTPRCHGVSHPATHAAEARNPACGDIVKLSFQLTASHLLQARTTGAGCAVSQASASLLTEQLQGKTLPEAHAILRELSLLLAQQPCNAALLGPLLALRLITENPARVRCAAIAREAALQALG